MTTSHPPMTEAHHIGRDACRGKEPVTVVSWMETMEALGFENAQQILNDLLAWRMVERTAGTNTLKAVYR